MTISLKSLGDELEIVLSSCEGYLDSFTIVEPAESASGNWEIWSIEPEGSDDVDTFEEVEFVPENKLAEIRTEASLNVQAVMIVIRAFELGLEHGTDLGQRRASRQFKYALAALSGDIDGRDLADAAEQYHHRNRN